MQSSARAAGGLLLCALTCTSLLAQPSKQAPARHGYDFTRPERGEILPNPTESVGTPPRLRTYVTAKEMSSGVSTSEATSDAASAVPRSQSPRNESTPAKTDQSKVFVDPERSPSAPPLDAEAWKSSQTARVSRHVEAVLAQQIAEAGLDGTFEYQPSGEAQTNPGLRAAEKRSWDRVVQSLAASWRAWKADHAAGATSPSESGPPVPARTEAAIPLCGELQIVHGVILLRGAPPSVTGDIADVGP